MLCALKKAFDSRALKKTPDPFFLFFLSFCLTLQKALSMLRLSFFDNAKFRGEAEQASSAASRCLWLARFPSLAVFFVVPSVLIFETTSSACLARWPCFFAARPQAAWHARNVRESGTLVTQSCSAHGRLRYWKIVVC